MSTEANEGNEERHTKEVVRECDNVHRLPFGLFFLRFLRCLLFRLSSSRSAAALLALSIAWAVESAQAQSFSLNWSTIDSGGGQSTGGVFTVTGTIGQPDAGRMTSGEFTLEGGFWGLIAVFQTPGAPRLSITNAGDAVVVYWPLTAEGFVLEHTNRLTGVAGPWPQVPLPYMTNAPNIFIRLTAPSGPRFYRLRKP